jgi:branched-chain amino acid transport system ATP-binding protein
MLVVDGVRSAYGKIEVLHGVSLEVRPREVVALVGSNGAGKTTLLRCISGIRAVTGGRILLERADLAYVPAHRRVSLGISQVPEARQIFAPLSVEDNLRLGAYTRRDRGVSADLDHVYELFPLLKDKRTLAGALSGGQQQMLAIGRALMARPKLLLLDEPSMGLAPVIAEQILATVPRFAAEGTTVLLVEQNAFAALSLADRGYVIETGRIVLSDAGTALLEDDRVRQSYLGL